MCNIPHSNLKPSTVACDLLGFIDGAYQRELGTFKTVNHTRPRKQIAEMWKNSNLRRYFSDKKSVGSTVILFHLQVRECTFTVLLLLPNVECCHSRLLKGSPSSATRSQTSVFTGIVFGSVSVRATCREPRLAYDQTCFAVKIPASISVCFRAVLRSPRRA